MTMNQPVQPNGQFLATALPQNRSYIDKLVWQNADEFRIGDIAFQIDVSQNRDRVVENKLSLSKKPPYLKAYFDHIDFSRVRNVMELGFFRGGSAAFFFELLNPDKLVTVEIRPEPPAEFKAYHQSSAARLDRLKLHTSINQANRAKLRTICETEFGQTPLDLVIDDASHMYLPTRISVETIFRRVRQGGYYVIEDWGWAHRGAFQKEGSLWHKEPALSNLLFELQMVQATHPDWIEKIVVLPFLIIVIPGAGVPSTEFSMDAAYVARGKKLELI